MILDTIHGLIERRVLLNYRIDPGVLTQVLPKPFRPKKYAGHGVGGVCMIRFGQLRPRLFPSWLGMASENAAHRIALEWDQDGTLQEGVYIPRRDTDSWFNKTLGGVVFPGIFQRSQFQVQETETHLSLSVLRQDGGTEIAFRGRVAESMPTQSIFPSLAEAAKFFSLGATGYSATHTPGHYHGMELHSLDWIIAPLSVEAAQSCVFNNSQHFPAGSAEVDCALLMRGISHEWHSRPDLYLSRDGDSLTSRRR